MFPVNVSAFLEAFCQWAQLRPDIEAVVLVGSYARDAATEDSDVDLVVLTSGVERYLRDRSWLSLFGDVNVGECLQEDYGRVTSLRAFYDGGLEVEFGFTTPDWADKPVDEGTLSVVRNGMKILYDPKGVVDRMQRNLQLGSDNCQ